MSKKQLFITFLVSSLILFATTPLRSASIEADLWVSFVLHFIAVQIILKTQRQNAFRTLCVYLLAQFAFLLLDLTLDIIDEIDDGESIKMAFLTKSWQCILPNFLAPIFSFLFFVTKGKRRIVVFSICLLIYLGNIFWFDRIWYNYMNYRVFKNETSEPLPKNWVAETKSGIKLTNEIFQKKIVLLDFWSSGCPACIKSFPVYNNFLQNCKSNSNTLTYSIFVPYKTDNEFLAENLISKNGYNFPVFIGNGLDTVFSIYSYPTVLVIFQNRIVFRGNLDGGMKKVIELSKQKSIADK